MLRIEEIAGAMDDDFRDALDGMDDERLAALKADKKSLDWLRPVGVSHREAMAMIESIMAARLAPPPPPPPPLSARRRVAAVLRETFRRLARSD